MILMFVAVFVDRLVIFGIETVTVDEVVVVMTQDRVDNTRIVGNLKVESDHVRLTWI
jgi:hypothetical protein